MCIRDRPGGEKGLPVKYEFNTTEEIQLFNLDKDIGEENDVALQYPTIIAKIDSLANNMRTKLGDSLKNIEGLENRSVGKIELSKAY